MYFLSELDITNWIWLHLQMKNGEFGNMILNTLFKWLFFPSLSQTWFLSLSWIAEIRIVGQALEEEET